MKQKLKALLALLLVFAMIAALAACGGGAEDGSSKEDQKQESGKSDEAVPGAEDDGISDDSPYKGKGYDLKEHKTIVVYSIGEPPADMQRIQDEVNSKYFGPWLNTTVEFKFLNFAEVNTKYSLLLTGGEQCDLIYTASWLNYASETANGGFMELDPQWLQQYMPYSYPQQAPISCLQDKASAKIYTVPKNNAAFNNYNMIVVRQDLMEKYDIPEINSWDSMIHAFEVIAENETSAANFYAMTQRGPGPGMDFADHLYWQSIQAEQVSTGWPFFYYHNNSEELPKPEDIFFEFDSDEFLELAKMSREYAEKKFWTPDRAQLGDVDDTSFLVNGVTFSYISNDMTTTTGKNMEAAGTGTYRVYDVTPECKAHRGSYADDAVSIASSCENPERAALVLDAIKGFPEVNFLIAGGIEGVHYILNEDGTREAGPEADNYPFNGWAWGWSRADLPGLAVADDRETYFERTCAAKEYAPLTMGFAFDGTTVETVKSVVDSLISEYQTSFVLGEFENVEEKWNEFQEKLKAAGYQEYKDEFIRQYTEYYNAHQ